MKEASTQAGLFKRDTDPFFFPPHNVAWRAVPVPLQNQGEVLRDISGGCDVEHRPGIRHIANHADNRAAVKLDGSGLQSLPGTNPRRLLTVAPKTAGPF